MRLLGHFFRWLYDNRQWVFDGIGVYVLTLIGGFFKIIWNRKNRRVSGGSQEGQNSAHAASTGFGFRGFFRVMALVFLIEIIILPVLIYLSFHASYSGNIVSAGSQRSANIGSLGRQTGTAAGSSSLSVLPGGISSAHHSPKITDLGNLRLSINGTQVLYYPAAPVQPDYGFWDISVSAGTSMNRNAILIVLPDGVRSGDEFTEYDAYKTSAAFRFQIYDNYSRLHTLGDKNNNEFVNFDLKITKWEGKGGFAEGTLSFTMRIATARGIETDSCQNGRFRIAIDES